MNDFDGELNKSLDDFMESYKMVDTEEIYSNGTEFVPIFRIKQWEEYNNKDKEIERLMSLWEFDRVSWNELMAEKETEIERLNNIIDKKEIFLGDNIKRLEREVVKRDNIIKEVRNQLDYLETYSSKEDVFEDMKRRLDRIDKIIGSDKE